MFGKNSSVPFQLSEGDTTFIAPACQIVGNIVIKGNARIDGQIEGSIKISGDLVIGTNAKVTASIEAKNVQIAGEVHGDISSASTLELDSTARLYGDICTQQLKIEQGARFVGSSKLIEDNRSAGTDNALNRTEKSPTVADKGVYGRGGFDRNSADRRKAR